VEQAHGRPVEHAAGEEPLCGWTPEYWGVDASYADVFGVPQGRFFDEDRFAEKDRAAIMSTLERLTPLEELLARLLATIPIELQRELEFLSRNAFSTIRAGYSG